MIPLTIVFVAIYFFKKSSEEIVYLCGIIAITALVLTLIIAPWQIQLFLLIIAALSTTKFWQPNQTITEIEVDNRKSLLYRGNNYENNSSNLNNLEIADADLEGKYRGQICWKSHHSKEATPQTFPVTYRGAATECQKYVTKSEQEKAGIKGNVNSETNNLNSNS
jgi:hypothetical protein